MAQLVRIWIEETPNRNPEIRLGWSNDRHQGIELDGSNPIEVIRSLDKLRNLLNRDLIQGNI